MERGEKSGGWKWGEMEEIGKAEMKKGGMLGWEAGGLVDVCVSRNERAGSRIITFLSRGFLSSAALAAAS